MTTQTKFHRAHAKYPKNIILWEKQRECVERARNDFKSQGYSFLKLGQRSGKSVIAAELSRDFKHVFHFDEVDTAAGQFPVDYHFCGARVPDVIEPGFKETKLAIMNEAMWLPGSFDLFEEIRPHATVLIISSNGPEFDDSRWKELGGHSFATWEINPRVSKAELIRDSDTAEQRALAYRDFGAY